MSADLDLALQWVQSTPAIPLGEDVVPGASDDERRMLAVLGGLVSAIVPAQERVGWPPDVLGWVNAGPQADKAVGAAALRAIRESPDKVLASIYARVFRIWLDDDTPSLDRTMAALDRRLKAGEEWLSRVESTCESLCRFACGFMPRGWKRREARDTKQEQAPSGTASANPAGA